eukprot:scaffold72298_cov28-Tisochrysis_lutea.AAC.3
MSCQVSTRCDLAGCGTRLGVSIFDQTRSPSLHHDEAGCQTPALCALGLVGVALRPPLRPCRPPCDLKRGRRRAPWARAAGKRGGRGKREGRGERERQLSPPALTCLLALFRCLVKRRRGHQRQEEEGRAAARCGHTRFGERD